MNGDGSGAGKAEKRLMDFLVRHEVAIGAIDERKISLSDVVAGAADKAQLSRFSALDDTLLYGRLLSLLVAHPKLRHVREISDIGAGSSLPTIKALLENPSRRDVRIVAVDSDAEALDVSKQNASAYGLLGRYAFRHATMRAYLAGLALSAERAVAANLPYLPVPEGLHDEKYRPVDGGPSGEALIAELIEHRMPAGAVVAIQWSSLSNPARIIDIIEEHYEVLSQAAHAAPFGSYTGSDDLFPNIARQRDLGRCVFFDTAAGRRFLFLGTILRRRS